MIKPAIILISLFSSMTASAAPEKPTAPLFILTSASFDNGASLPNKMVANVFGCKGKNDSPALDWTDGPEGTASYAVTVFDPDAPSGSGWWHWTLFNIPVDETTLPEGMKNLPKGSTQGRNDFGRSRYDGACPPPGSKPHRYVFTVYALKTAKLSLDSEASGAMVGFYIQKNMLAKASIIATFSR